MKKKFKLFATVASLCLAIALMGFGVYAATSVTVTISSSVSYNVSGHIAFKVYGSGAAGTAATTGSEQTAELATVGVTSEGTETGTAISAVALTATNRYAIYTFTIENIGSTAITSITASAKVTDPNLATSADTVTIPDGSLATDEKVTFSVYVHLEDENVSVTTGTVSIEIEVAA